MIRGAESVTRLELGSLVANHPALDYSSPAGAYGLGLSVLGPGMGRGRRGRLSASELRNARVA
jgi:hypothetical protein